MLETITATGGEVIPLALAAALLVRLLLVCVVGLLCCITAFWKNPTTYNRLRKLLDDLKPSWPSRRQSNDDQQAA